MTQGMEAVPAVFPAEFTEAVLQDLLKGSLSDMGSFFGSGEEPVLGLCPAAAFLPVPDKDVLKAHGKFDLSGITVLADFLGNGDDPVSEGDITETEGDHFAHTQGCAVSDGKCGHVFDVLCSKDDRHDVRFRRHFRERMVHLAQGEVVIGKRPAENKAEILLQGAVVDVDGTWRIAQAAVFFTAFEVQEKRTQMHNICVVEKDVIGGCQPYAALKDRLEIAVDRARTVIDQFQDIRDVLEFFSIERRLCVLHVLSFQKQVCSNVTEQFLKGGARVHLKRKKESSILILFSQVFLYLSEPP